MNHPRSNKDIGKTKGTRSRSRIIVTEFGVDASSYDPGTPFRFEGRGRRGSFKVGSCPGLKGVAAPLLADLIGIRRLSIADWGGFVR